MPDVLEDFIEQVIKKVEGPYTVQLLKAGLLGIAGAAGGALASAVWSMVYYTTAQQKEDEFRLWAANVSKELDIISSQLYNLTAQFESGVNQLSAQISNASYKQMHGEVLGYGESVNTIFNMFSTILKKPGQTEKSATEDIKRLKDICVSHHLLTKTHLIANTCGGGEDIYHSSNNMMETWTDACIVSMGANISQVTRYYYNLEYDYLQSMSYVIKAYTVMAALMNYDNNIGLNEKDEETAKWLDDQVARYIKPMSDSFIMCAERLVLATYRPDVMLQDSAAIPFAAPEDVYLVGSRSQLNYFIYTNMDEAITQPGIIVKEYLRPSMAAAPINASICLEGEANVKMVGKPLAPPKKYTNGTLMPYWYKVVDKDAKNNLVPFEDSDITICMYRQPYKDPKGKKLLFSSPVLSNGAPAMYAFTYEYFDPITCERLDLKQLGADVYAARKENAFALAYMPLSDSIAHTQRQAYPINYLNSRETATQWQFDDHSKKELEKNARDNSVVVAGPGAGMGIIEISAWFRAAIISTNHNFPFYSKYPVRYASKTNTGQVPQTLSGRKSDPVKLLLVHDTRLIIDVDNYKNNSHGIRECRIRIDIYAKDDKNKIASYFNHRYESNTHLSWRSTNFEDKENSYFPNEAPNVDKNKMGIPLTPGKDTVLHWEVELELKGLNTGIDGLWDSWYQGSIALSARFAWPVPVPKFG